MARQRVCTPHQQTRVEARVKPCKPIFRDMVFVLSGDLGPDKPHASIELWIKNHAGRVEKDVTENTTHLVCSIDNFKTKVAVVQKAGEQGIRCKIVGWEYIEDCLIGPGAPRKLSERPYRLSKVLSRLRTAKRRENGIKAKYEGDAALTKDLVDHSRHHIYMDELFFEYKIVLTRITWNGRTGKPITDIWTIFLFESNAKPCHYMVGGKFRSGRRPLVFYRDHCLPMLFCDALRAFKGLFRKLTGIEWDQRCDELPQQEDKYRYLVPTGGKVVGVLPLGWTPPRKTESELVSDEDTVTDESDASDSDRGGYTARECSRSEDDPESDRSTVEPEPMTSSPYTPGITLNELQTHV